ncbi:hypothetical protein GcC1_217021 [Golovinomyces cichoracearum]|uniref:Uncharacterized protein n=1 Tax=Golovinomyces cichoracearum TaxID=62708 RepID=A0A420H8N9_9PEZI|nr:hypothetical protein GcC1_217021 [Golovinomyces cichoracearum]
MELPPPPYSAAPQNESYRFSPRAVALKSARPRTAPEFNGQRHADPRSSLLNLDQNFHRFPRSFGFYYAINSTADIVIALHANDRHSLFYISSHLSSNSQPSLVLHSSPHASSSPLATANINFVSDTVAIKLYDSPTSVIKAQSAKTSYAQMTFIAQLPGCDSMEQFAWKDIYRRERILSDKKMNGMKLINCETGEIVATWTKPKFSHRKLGKMNFMSRERSKLGERFELMAVLTLLSILEREREEVRGNTF